MYLRRRRTEPGPAPGCRRTGKVVQIMRVIKTRRGEVLLFSDRLQEQLEKVLDYPLTVVEGPAGFGKTTAVREYLRDRVDKDRRSWYTCLGESASRAWLGICELNVQRGKQRVERTG